MDFNKTEKRAMKTIDSYIAKYKETENISLMGKIIAKLEQHPKLQTKYRPTVRYLNNGYKNKI